MVKAQYNPSTLKAIYNAATNKAQIAVRLYIPPNGDDFVDPPRDVEYSDFDCVHCPWEGKTPRQITVKLSGLTFCAGCYEVDYPAFKSVSWNGGSNPNGLYLLTQLGAEYSCHWRTIRAVGTLYRDTWTDPACQNLHLHTDYGNEIRVNVRWTAADWELDVFYAGPEIFNGGFFPADSDCLNKTGILNTYNTCGPLQPWIGGTGEIREGNQMP